jgi:hypothetical protein
MSDSVQLSSGRLARGIIVVSAVVVIGAFMSILDMTIVNVASEFDHPLWWAVALTALAVVPALVRGSDDVGALPGFSQVWDR